MKTILTILASIICQTVLAQFAIVTDKDGFVNVRSSAGIAGTIIDTLMNGQVVFCLEPEKDWFPIDYDLGRQSKSGYIHKSRLKFIKDFEEVPYHILTDSGITFKKDSFKLTITKGQFNPAKNELQYEKENPSKNEARFLEKINGKRAWGTDGNMPRRQYRQMLLQLGNEKIYLPAENLFEPNLKYTTVNVDKNSKTIYISALNGDAAGAYAVLWIIENGKFKQRMITIPF